jgi:hypothetical protein
MKRKPKAQSVVPITDKLNEVRMTDEEAAEIRALWKNRADVLTDIGQHEINYENTRLKLFASLNQAADSLQKRGEALLAAHGLNSAEWILKAQTGTFERKR